MSTAVLWRPLNAGVSRLLGETMSKLYEEKIAECPKCHAAIGDHYSHRRCIECGEPLSEEILARIIVRDKSKSLTTSATSNSLDSQFGYGDSPIPLMKILNIAIGLISAGFGLYFLLIRPGEENIVNLQRLTLGETFTIVGAIFLASEMRSSKKT